MYQCTVSFPQITFICIALLFLSANETSAIGDDEASDQALPDVTIENMEGDKVNIRELAKNDKITVISFWATWCKPCKRELSNLASLYPDWQEQYNVEIVAVSTDDSRNRSNVVTYVNGQGWDYQVLLDSNQKLKRALNFQAIPYTVLLNSDGNIVYTHKGYVSGDEYVLEDEIKKIAND